jgi:serine/threonine-protein kinase
VARPTGLRVDHYELIEHLADGAEAEVHRARDLRTGLDVVVKFPHRRTLDHPELAARWRRELSITERLADPHLQCRLDTAERHSEPYAVLEYAERGSLDHLLLNDGPLPVEQVVIWGRQLAGALAYLHSRGVIHRDLKPANLLLTGDCDLKLADFGAATVVRRRRWLPTFPTPPEGTPEYLSPEQVTGEVGDARSDIYGWGIVMYEMLTGRVPFSGADALAAMTAHLTEHPTPIRILRPETPTALEAVVLHAMRRQPAQRYPDADTLLADLVRLGELDAASFDVTPEPPLSGAVGGSETRAVVRFVALVAAVFFAVISSVIALTILFR